MQKPDACLEDVEDIDASNLLETGKVHRGSFFLVVNEDFYSVDGTKIGAQQIHVLEMRGGVRRVHLD
jgi:hypothetical protein